ncbi:MAG: hypothetical protein IIW17_09005 [Clostridia bacterium]|nr:hypothetical protein [Clostridia bacterium]MBQ5794142.1 hypothetical protein [Clostridia bacterium]
MPEKLTKQDCIELLVSKYAALGGERYPKRDDFSEREVVAIKAYLGPWPRALEAAGIKPARDDGRAEKNKQKHIRSKRLRTEAKLAKRASARDEVSAQTKKSNEKKENSP